MLDWAETYVKYHGGFDKLLHSQQQPRTTKPTVTWVYGGTGLGKTRAVVALEHDLWISGAKLDYFNGYSGQRAALFDDFRGSLCPLHVLLQVIDRYAYIANIKFGHEHFTSERIYFTSSRSPTLVYNLGRGEIGQLLRRIDNVIELVRDFDGGVISLSHKGEDPLRDILPAVEPPSPASIWGDLEPPPEAAAGSVPGFVSPYLG